MEYIVYEIWCLNEDASIEEIEVKRSKPEQRGQEI